MTGTTYFQLLVLNLLLIFGIWKIFQPDMVFGKVGDCISRKLGEYWSKPVVNCPACMSSIYGTIFFWASPLDEYFPWVVWPLHCLALCGLATIVTFLDHE